MGLALLSLSTVQATEPKSSAPKHWLVDHPVIQELHQRHNAERARVGLTALVLDKEMCLAAQRHAVWMAETGWFSHSGLPYRENIFMGVRQAEDAVNGWIWSPAHHGNMLSGQRAGYGYMHIQGRSTWVAVFQ